MTHKMSPLKFSKTACLFFVFILLLSPIALAKDYDGLFFMGLNLQKDVFNDVKVRRAINYAIDRKYIATKIMSEEVVPSGIIPPQMVGYNPSFESYKYNPTLAKKGIKEKMELILLHTDGVKTIAIAEKIKKDLSNVGVKVKLKQVNYSDQDKWEAELKSGRHHLFLMGYKSGFISASNEALSKPNPIELIRALFGLNGEANFTFFYDRRVENLLNQLSETNESMKSLREAKLNEINKIIQDESPTVNLFYIPKL
ncbi:MAG: peptide/nickel transport system substrate-binding protein [Candidatus Saganbacteria bacterium]|uniref:Peptide/nickel transport system substrate-binding protein n=1 Tax=Candidatus Saganbacteria bacterium TaxID=2575572 RepID=A0A833NYZ2_UNCSA|nr:MAG: peptide/nickel transport system substrate-binding protein [Candidatus Saganbacteria bacterium]